MTGDSRREAVLVLNAAARRLGAGEASCATASLWAVNGGPDAAGVWVHVSGALLALGASFRRLDALPRAEQQQMLLAAAEDLAWELQGRDRAEEAAGRRIAEQPTDAAEVERLRDENEELQLRVQELTAELAAVNERLDQASGVSE